MAHQGERPLTEANLVSRPSVQESDAESNCDGASVSTESSNNREEKPFVSPIVPPSSRVSQLNPKNWSRKMRIVGLVSAILALLVTVPAIALPLALNHRQSTALESALLVNPPDTVMLANDTALRIMPLGASITYGFLSSDGNGYREDLRTLIQQGGNTNITYVGSRNNGTMTNNAVEGWPGYRIDQVLPKAQVSVPATLPNVILLNVGTNDCVQNYNLDNTTKASTVAPQLTSNSSYTVGDRMRLLVEDLLTWSPEATVVMSTLILNKKAATNARVNNANAKFAAVAAALQAQGKRVVLANMSAEAGGPNATTMADVTHPNDVGYSLMANRWYLALREASEKNLIVAPQ